MIRHTGGVRTEDSVRGRLPCRILSCMAAFPAASREEHLTLTESMDNVKIQIKAERYCFCGRLRGLSGFGQEDGQEGGQETAGDGQGGGR